MHGDQNRKREVTISLGEDNDTDGLALVGDEGDNEDDGYSPSRGVSDEDMSDGSENVSLDAEDDLARDEYGPIIEDSYDPFEDEIFECDNEQDNYLTKLYNNGEVYKDEGFGKIVLKPWQLFMDKQHLRDVVRDYCIQCGFAVVVEWASNKRYCCRCFDVNCGWRLHASVLPDQCTWAIKSIQSPKHTCAGLETRNSMVNVKWAKRVLLEDIRANNDVPAKALNVLLWKRYGVNMAQSTLYRVRTKALVEIHGGHDASYKDLPMYYDVIKQLNPNSLAHCAWKIVGPDRPMVFSSIFIAFKASIDGLSAGCKSLIGVDGAHLKGNYGGVLLSAVALDGNNEIFPIAWAIVGAEDADS
ncbi:uncharacterized protein LOC110715580 [Chenopodium quinoa]|uniref:uncharacterized protein LOC110715580 n=1 Tax=Chenopodium quinoa TaxID=63459 RepID=UPI000B781D1F|nr:uncharacterized protein LOC110715580 [Chenopodium quinoa]